MPARPPNIPADTLIPKDCPGLIVNNRFSRYISFSVEDLALAQTHAPVLKGLHSVVEEAPSRFNACTTFTVKFFPETEELPAEYTVDLFTAAPGSLKVCSPTSVTISFSGFGRCTELRPLDKTIHSLVLKGTKGSVKDDFWWSDQPAVSSAVASKHYTIPSGLKLKHILTSKGKRIKGFFLSELQPLDATIPPIPYFQEYSSSDQLTLKQWYAANTLYRVSDLTKAGLIASSICLLETTIKPNPSNRENLTRKHTSLSYTNLPLKEILNSSSFWQTFLKVNPALKPLLLTLTDSSVRTALESELVLELLSQT